MTDFTAIKQLYGITASCGLPPEDIGFAREIFGAMPEVLADYYMELGGDRRLNHTQDSLVLPGEFPHVRHDDYLIFYLENQCCCVWGIHRDDLTEPNPPVYMSENRREWRLEAESLTEFLTAMAFLQAAFALEHGSDIFELEAANLETVRKRFARREAAFRQWTCGIEFYGNHPDEIVMVMGGGGQLLYASDSGERFGEMERMLRGVGSRL